MILKIVIPSQIGIITHPDRLRQTIVSAAAGFDLPEQADRRQDGSGCLMRGSREAGGAAARPVTASGQYQRAKPIRLDPHQTPLVALSRRSKPADFPIGPKGLDIGLRFCFA
jgi:hypothetical protein